LRDVARPNVGVNFDPGNFLLYGTDDPLPALRLLQPWVRGFHCKDGMRPVQAGLLGREPPLGQGDVPLAEVLTELLRANYSGPLVIERERSSRPSPRSWRLATCSKPCCRDWSNRAGCSTWNDLDGCPIQSPVVAKLDSSLECDRHVRTRVRSAQRRSVAMEKRRLGRGLDALLSGSGNGGTAVGRIPLQRRPARKWPWNESSRTPTNRARPSIATN